MAVIWGLFDVTLTDVFDTLSGSHHQSQPMNQGIVSWMERLFSFTEISCKMIKYCNSKDQEKLRQSVQLYLKERE